MTGFKGIFKDIIATQLFTKISKGNRFIFVFHDISNPNDAHYTEEYSTPLSRFQQQIDILAKIFEFISLEQIVSNINLDASKNYAAITFDDGYYSILKNARPILNKKGIPYAIFVNAAAITDNQLWFSNIKIAGKEYENKLLHTSETEITNTSENPVTAIYTRGWFTSSFREEYKIKEPGKKLYMDASDINELKKEGVLIGSHGYDHFVLNSCDEKTAVAQIEENNKLLQQITNEPSLHFAIPFGKKEHYSKENILTIKQSGTRYIYTTNPNKFNAKDLKTTNFLFPRISIIQQTPKQLLFIINRALLKKYDL